MTKTFADIVTDVQRDLSQMAGRGVQIYSEQRIAGYLQMAFELVFTEYNIPEYGTWQTVALDGVNGLPTTDMLVTDFEDIGRIYIHATEREVRRAPTSRNMNRLSGTTAMFVEPRFIQTPDDFKRPFFIWPKTATDSLDVWGVVHPPNFTPNDYIFCDDLLLRLGACWLYTEDDATNIGQIAKFKELFNKRLAQMQSSAMQLPASLDARQEPLLTEWVG